MHVIEREGSERGQGVVANDEVLKLVEQIQTRLNPAQPILDPLRDDQTRRAVVKQETVLP